MHTSGHQYILFHFLFQIMVNKEQGKQNRKKVSNLQKAFSLRTIIVCQFEIIDGVKYVSCIKHLQISSEGTSSVCGRSLTLASMCFLFALVVGLLWCLTYDEEEDNDDVKDNLQEKKENKEGSKDTTINEMMKECIDELEESLR